MKIFKILAISILTISIVAVATLGGLLWYVQNADHRELITSTAKQKGDYTVRIDGEVKLNIWPNINFYATNVGVKSFTSEEDMLHIESIDVTGDLITAIMGGGISNITVKGVNANLEVDREGKPNWQKLRKSRHDKGLQVSDLAIAALLGNVQITDLNASFKNLQTGQYISLNEGNLLLDARDLSNTKFTTWAKINQMPFQTNVIADLMSGGELPLTAVVSLDENTLDLNGKLVALNHGGAYEGMLELTAPKLLETANNLTPTPLTKTAFDEKIVIKSFAQLSNKFIELSDMQAQIGAVNVHGRVSLTPPTAKATGKIALDLNSQAIDLNALKICSIKDEGGSGDKSAYKKSSNDDFKWPDERIDLSILKLLDLNAKLTIGELKCSDKILEKVNINTKNEDGALDLSNFSAWLNKGEIIASGKIKGGNTNYGNVKVKLNNFPVEALLPSKKARLVNAPVSGDLNFNFKGRSVEEFMHNLDGSIDATSKGGYLMGVSLANIGNTLKGFMGGSPSVQQITEFEDIKIVAKLEKGIARTDSFNVNAGDVNATGEGKVDLANWAINYRIIPTIENGNWNNVTVPVIIRGSLTNPQIVADITSKETISTGVEKLIGGERGRLIGGALGSLLGSSTTSEPSNQGSPTEDTQPAKNIIPQELINKSLNRWFGN